MDRLIGKARTLREPGRVVHLSPVDGAEDGDRVQHHLVGVVHDVAVLVLDAGARDDDVLRRLRFSCAD